MSLGFSVCGPVCLCFGFDCMLSHKYNVHTHETQEHKFKLSSLYMECLPVHTIATFVRWSALSQRTGLGYECSHMLQRYCNGPRFSEFFHGYFENKGKSISCNILLCNSSQLDRFSKFSTTLNIRMIMIASGNSLEFQLRSILFSYDPPHLFFFLASDWRRASTPAGFYSLSQPIVSFFVSRNSSCACELNFRRYAKTHLITMGCSINIVAKLDWTRVVAGRT